MKSSTRILLGILFPFILLITVTSISKALKNEESIQEITPQKSLKTNTPVGNSSSIPATLTKYSSN